MTDPEFPLALISFDCWKDDTKFLAKGVKMPKLLCGVPALLPSPRRDAVGSCVEYTKHPLPPSCHWIAFPLVPLLEFHHCNPALIKTERVLNDFAFFTHGKLTALNLVSKAIVAPAKVPCSQSCFSCSAQHSDLRQAHSHHRNRNRLVLAVTAVTSRASRF